MLAYFNLMDHPFRTTPETTYFFLGRHHEEALAHLRYALGEGEGFTVITGERGAGKSTLCRAFLEQTGPRAATALIDQPAHTPHELMRLVNRQFGLKPTALQNLKSMIDALNVFLMQQRLDGKKVALFIDDAQRLPPEALEQVRLVSNLETTREKLIQIILVGEPELMRLLDTHALRQMRQRISVCYEIGPLAPEETEAYIQHRMSRASKGPPQRFDPAAVQRIYRFARGNPRRINQACQAMLETAFKTGRKSLDLDLAEETLRSISGRGEPAEPPAARRKALAGGLAAAALVAVASGAFLLQQAGRPPKPAPAAASPAPPAPAPAAVISAADVQAALPAPPSAAPAPAPTAAAAPVPAPVTAPEPAAEPGPETAGMPAPPAPAPPEAIAAPEVARSPAPPTRTRTPSPPAGPVAANLRPVFSVQVGAYRVPENADLQVARLKAKGYPARILPLKDSQGRSWHTVRIGDHANRQAAQAQADEFNRREAVNSIVRPFGAF